MQRALHPAPASRCSHCTCVKPIKSCLCLQHSCLIKDILALHEAHIHLTLFWSELSPPCLAIVPRCWLLPMPIWLQDPLTWQGPCKCRHRALAMPRLHLSFPSHNAERHALLLNASKVSWMLSVPDSAVMFMLHATDWLLPRCVQ